MTLRAVIDHLLYRWLQVEDLCQRGRHADHSRETFDAVLDTCERIARDKYAPHNRLVDTQEPRFDGEKVILPQATHEAHQAYVATGMLAAAQDAEMGGMQLPFAVESAANAFFACASISIGAMVLSDDWPCDRTIRTGMPASSTTALILVLSPPRERPMA